MSLDRRALAGIAFLTLCLPLLGCVSRPNRLRSETFGFAPPAKALSPGSDPVPVLVLRAVRVVPAYDSQDFLYRASDYRYERDPYAHFLAPPDQIIRSAANDALQASGLFQAVVSGGSSLLTHAFAEISVRQLYGDFRPGRPPTAVIALRILLVQSPGGVPLWNETLLRRIPLRERSASALMRGWNEGLRQILAEAGPPLAKRIRAADEAAQKTSEKAEEARALKSAPAPLPAPTPPSGPG